MKIAEISGRAAPGLPGDPQYFGIEVEMEYVHWPVATSVQRCWGITEDGSLRNNGAEFVSPPVTREMAVENLDILYEAADLNDWRSGPRTGIHLHMDMTHREQSEVLSILTAYAAVEPVIFTLCGDAREANIFCVPWYRASSDLPYIRKALTAVDKLVARMDLREVCKYTALNTAPLAKFGTIEFRGAPTYPEAAQVLRLMDVFDHLITTAGRMPAEEVADLFDDDPLQGARLMVPSLAGPRAVRLMEEADTAAIAASLVRTRSDDDWTLPRLSDTPRPEFPARGQRRDRVRLRRETLTEFLDEYTTDIPDLRDGD